MTLSLHCGWLFSVLTVSPCRCPGYIYWQKIHVGVGQGLCLQTQFNLEFCKHQSCTGESQNTDSKIDTSEKTPIQFAAKERHGDKVLWEWRCGNKVVLGSSMHTLAWPWCIHRCLAGRGGGEGLGSNRLGRTKGWGRTDSPETKAAHVPLGGRPSKESWCWIAILQDRRKNHKMFPVLSHTGN